MASKALTLWYALARAVSAGTITMWLHWASGHNFEVDIVESDDSKIREGLAITKTRRKGQKIESGASHNFYLI